MYLRIKLLYFTTWPLSNRMLVRWSYSKCRQRRSHRSSGRSHLTSSRVCHVYYLYDTRL